MCLRTIPAYRLPCLGPSNKMYGNKKGMGESNLSPILVLQAFALPLYQG